jgi:hypothetical protein
VTASSPRAHRPAARIHGHRPPPHARIGIAIAVDLSDESAFAVKWAVQNYLRTGDAIVLLHVHPTAVLYGADWDSIPVSVDDDTLPAAPGDEPDEARKKREDFDAFTSIKAQDLAQPLITVQIPFKIHIVKDHDMSCTRCLKMSLCFMRRLRVWKVYPVASSCTFLLLDLLIVSFPWSCQMNDSALEGIAGKEKWCILQ